MAITDTINCDCDDLTGYRTFADLRTAVFAALGFVDPTLPQDTRTLATLRAELFRMLGFAAMGGNYPPGMSALLDDWLNESQQLLWRRFELNKGNASLPPRMTVDGDTNTLDATLVLSMATYLAKAHYGKTDAKDWKEIAERGVADRASRFPPGATAAVNQHLKAAHALIYRRYDALRTERFFSWDLAAGVALYDFPDNEEACSKKLDPYKVRTVHVTDNDGARRPLTQGIPARAMGYDTSGPPTHFELRQCIHVWPAPDVSEGSLIIRGHFGPEAFAADGDQPGVDDELVYLLALANAKAQYNQPDANLYMSQFEVHLGKIRAGSHGTRRYIPGARADVDHLYTAPKPLVPFP